LLIIFCDPGLKNCWHGWPGVEPTTLDLCSQSPGAYDLSAAAQPKLKGQDDVEIMCHNFSTLMLLQREPPKKVCSSAEFQSAKKFTLLPLQTVPSPITGLPFCQ